MQKQTIKKIGILSVVLMGASAVVAAVIPSKNSDEVVNGPGKLQASSLGVDTAQTCITLPSGQVADCTNTSTVNDAAGASSTSDQGSGSATGAGGAATGTGTTHGS